MSQRLQGLSHEDATSVAGEVFAASDKFLGRTSNLVRILSNHSPYIARWFSGWSPPCGSPISARPRMPGCEAW